ncbi:MAG: exodeoxyribonuclease VII large subunit [Alphaproteobacteria bacterium]
MNEISAPSALIDQPRPGANAPEFTVSEISRELKQVVEERFGHVRVRGEIGECKFHGNGHVYLSLKDDKSVLAAVIWKGGAGRLGFKPEAGMEVVCTGRLTTYAGQSKYQLVVEAMALAGEGALLKLIEERKKRLMAEGLFSPERKKPLPFMPRRIGVVTSPTGAVIRDILHRVEDRFPCPIVIWPVAVQGPLAAEQIVSAINGFNALAEDSPLRPDVLIIARGGGSVEDLMPFNEEIVVRAAAASAIPLISAVGHETDTTLIDFAADRRAPTPTAAAEMAVPVRAELLANLHNLAARQQQANRRGIEARRDRLMLVARALGDPRRMLEPLWQRADDRAERLKTGMSQILLLRRSALAGTGGRLPHPREWLRLAAQKLSNESRAMESAFRQRVQSFRELERRLPEIAARGERAFGQRWEQWHERVRRAGQLLVSLSPQGVLQRGYALVRAENGQIVSSAAGAKLKQKVALIFHDGEAAAQILPRRDGGQGSLF